MTVKELMQMLTPLGEDTEIAVLWWQKDHFDTEDNPLTDGLWISLVDKFDRENFDLIQDDIAEWFHDRMEYEMGED